MNTCEICGRSDIFHAGLCDQCDQMEGILNQHFANWHHDMMQIAPEHFANITLDDFIKRTGAYLAKYGEQ